MGAIERGLQPLIHKDGLFEQRGGELITSLQLSQIWFVSLSTQILVHEWVAHCFLLH